MRDHTEHARLRQSQRLFGGPQRILEHTGLQIEEAISRKSKLAQPRRIGGAEFHRDHVGRGEDVERIETDDAARANTILTIRTIRGGDEPGEGEAERRRPVQRAAGNDLGHRPAGGVAKRFTERLSAGGGLEGGGKCAQRGLPRRRSLKPEPD